ALAGCLRETDLVGWHRTDWTAGALLTEIDAEPEAARLIGDKVFRSVGARLPAQIACGLRVRVYRYGVSGTRGFQRLFGASHAGEVLTASPPSGVPRPKTAESVLQPHSSGGTPLAQHAGAP